MSHDKFYTDLMQIWKNGGKDGTEGGWAGIYYGVFNKVVKENNFKNVAEVGIGYGFHAKYILDGTNVDKLYLIDPMKWYPNDSFATDVMKYGGFEKLVKNIKLNLKPYEDRYTWFRKSSTEVTTTEIPDNSLDAVFIDADHSYSAVKADLHFWWKKVKNGGWVLGDDYSQTVFGVKRAVDEFVNQYDLGLEFLYKENGLQHYPIYKIIKNKEIN
tara:strand:+ start:325 stop:966 length:642 start_codon:yes stop_codon:yes gene_type:complete